MDNADTLGILKQLERGEINAREADTRLNSRQVERTETPPREDREKMELPKWMQLAWSIPIGVGILVVLFGAWIIVATVHANILWFLLGVPIVLFGSLLIVIGASVFSGHWVYINIEESRRNHHTLRFGVPLPIGLIRLVLWFAPWVVKMTGNPIRINNGRFNWNDDWDDPAQVIAAFERELNAGRGITIDVNEKNERVQVYIV